MSTQAVARRAAAAMVVVAAVLVASRAVRAEPRFAVREGMACGRCHLNGAGGGMRNDYGTAFSQTALATWRERGHFDPYLGERVAIGANLRLRNRTRFAAHTHLGDDHYDTPAANTFDVPEGNLYVRADAIPDRLVLYVDETVSPEAASNREAYVMVRAARGAFYAKAGRFLLPFGLRVPDDTVYIRQESGFNYANQDLGVEFGVDLRPLSAQVALTNGSQGASDDNLLKQVTARTEFVWAWGRVGASFSWNDASRDAFSFHSFTTALHAGARLGRLILLGEILWIRGVGDAQTYDQGGFYVEADFEAYKGLYLLGTFEGFDPEMAMANNERDRFTAGVSWFPIPYLELRAIYRVNRDIPQRVEGNADDLTIEFHGFL